MGLCPQEFNVDPFANPRQIVDWMGGYFGMNAKQRKERIDYLIERFDLVPHQKKQFRELSGGLKRRVVLARALVNDPKLIILDEPTAGLDPQVRREIYDIIEELRKDKKTVLITTHYIEEAEEMADRVGVINHGRIVLVEEKAALMRKLGKRRLTLALQEPLAALPKELAGWPLELEDGGRRLSYRFDASAEDTGVPTLLRRLGEIGVDFKDLDTTTTTLEDIFVDLVGRAA